MSDKGAAYRSAYLASCPRPKILTRRLRLLFLMHCRSEWIRFCPPLVITKEAVDTGLDRFEAAVKKAVSCVLNGSNDPSDVVMGTLSYFTNSIENFDY